MSRGNSEIWVEETQRYEWRILRDMSGETQRYEGVNSEILAGKLIGMRGETQRYEGGNLEIWVEETQGHEWRKIRNLSREYYCTIGMSEGSLESCVEESETFIDISERNWETFVMGT
jgi:hypothetical protein